MQHRHFVIWILVFMFQAAARGQSPADFTYRRVQVEFVDAGGRGVPNAAIYGFAPELNLVWPRRDEEFHLRDDILWHESYLGKMDSHGRSTDMVPPAKWEFFALGTNTDGAVVAGWNEVRVDKSGGQLRLAADVKRRWTFSMAKDIPVNPTALYLRPGGFPIWISIDVPGGQEKAIQFPKGTFQIWASAPPDKAAPGFALDWGTLSERSLDGEILALQKPALVDLPIRGGHGAIRWSLPKSFGISGEFSIGQSSQLWMSAGNYLLGYDRQIFPGINGHFLAQYYTMRPAQRMTLDLGSPLKASVGQGLGGPGPNGAAKLTGQLFLTDANGHLLARLMDANDELMPITASVSVAGRRVAAKPVDPREEKGGEDEDLDLKPLNHCMYVAKVDPRSPIAAAVWEFSTPAGLLAKPGAPENWKIVAASSTFKMEVPRALMQTANSLLRQMDVLAGAMEIVSKRKRQKPVTTITFEPEKRHGASASHNGAHITCGPGWFYTENPVAKHAVVHELGHNFGFNHGGLHETVVEVTRCFGAPQISQQPEKWIFLDRMNGIPRAGLHVKYPNIGLYLYCYAQRGARFLDFMTRTEQNALRKLTKQGFTSDEVTIALLNLGMQRDVTAIALKNGLNATPDRIAAATNEINAMGREAR